MVSPVGFAFNEQTAGNNAFQQRTGGEAAWAIQQRAREEFDGFVAMLRKEGVEVDVIEDTLMPSTPDSIFPNNVFSTHNMNGERTLVWYPMFAPNRRQERSKLHKYLDSFTFDRVVDLTPWESKGQFLEGTGSMVLDREHCIAYACRSPRTDDEVLRTWAETMGYTTCRVDAVDANGVPVYHTNVMMHVGSKLAAVCLDAIRDVQQRRQLTDTLEATCKQVVDITLEQMNHFAGNMLEVRGKDGMPLLVMSATAKRALNERQTDALSRLTRIVAPEIATIETAGGGSARCMMAEIYNG